MIHTLKQLIPQSLKNIYHLTLAIVANVRYGFPAREIPIVAVTGTDGKTTTAAMMMAIFREAGKKVAMASTVEFCIGDVCEKNATKFTTISSMKLQAFLRRAVREECDVVVLEVSSHSLDQNRIWGVRPVASALTNITREHLDYHKTMEQYREAKKKLFRLSQTSVINASLDRVNDFTRDLEGVVLYGVGSGHVQATNIREEEDGVVFSLEGEEIHLPILGKHNVENALAAICVTRILGVSLESASRVLESFRGVPGRFEWIKNNRGVHVLIDYAVTPAALTQLYQSIDALRHKTEGRVIAVFGACGDRDRGKRSIMGRIVDKVADIIILTNEDPYWEDPEQILNEVEQGIEKKTKDVTYFRILDRCSALQKALSLAKEGDYVVITGKGAEETMMIRGEMIPWNDKKAAKALLESISNLEK